MIRRNQSMDANQAAAVVNSLNMPIRRASILDPNLMKRRTSDASLLSLPSASGMNFSTTAAAALPGKSSPPKHLSVSPRNAQTAAGQGNYLSLNMRSTSPANGSGTAKQGPQRLQTYREKHQNSKNIEEQSMSSRYSLRSSRSMRFAIKHAIQSKKARNKGKDKKKKDKKNKRKEKIVVESVSSEEDLDKIRYVDKDNWRMVNRQIKLDGDDNMCASALRPTSGSKAGTENNQQSTVACEDPIQALKRFDPIPSDDHLHWIYYYFFPYNRTFNTARCMTFEIDERQDQLASLRKLYDEPNLTMERRKDIEINIKFLEEEFYNDNKFKYANKWYELFTDFIISKDLYRRSRVMQLFEKIAALEEGTFEMPKNMQMRKHFVDYLERKLRKQAAERRAKQQQEEEEEKSDESSQRSCSCNTSQYSGAKSCKHVHRSDPGEKSPDHDLLLPEDKIKKRNLRRAQSKQDNYLVSSEAALSRHAFLSRQPVNSLMSSRRSSISGTGTEEESDSSVKSKKSRLSAIEEQEKESPDKNGESPYGKFQEGLKSLMQRPPNLNISPDQPKLASKRRLDEATPGSADATPTPLLPRGRNRLLALVNVNPEMSNTPGQTFQTPMQPASALPGSDDKACETPAGQVIGTASATQKNSGSRSNTREKEGLLKRTSVGLSQMNNMNNVKNLASQMMSKMGSFLGEKLQAKKVVRKANHREYAPAPPVVNKRAQSTRMLPLKALFSPPKTETSQNNDADTASKQVLSETDGDSQVDKQSVLANLFRKQLQKKIQEEQKEEERRKKEEEERMKQESPESPRYTQILLKRQSSIKAGKVTKDEAIMFTIHQEQRQKEEEQKQLREQLDFLGAKKKRLALQRRTQSTAALPVMKRTGSVGGGLGDKFKQALLQKMMGGKNPNAKQGKGAADDQQSEHSKASMFKKTQTMLARPSFTFGAGVKDKGANQKTENRPSEKQQSNDSIIKLQVLEPGTTPRMSKESNLGDVTSKSWMGVRSSDETDMKNQTSDKRKSQFAITEQEVKGAKIDSSNKDSVSLGSSSSEIEIGGNRNITKPVQIQMVSDEETSKGDASSKVQSSTPQSTFDKIPKPSSGEQNAEVTAEPDQIEERKPRQEKAKTLVKKKSSTRMFQSKLKIQTENTIISRNTSSESGGDSLTKTKTIIVEPAGSDSEGTATPPKPLMDNFKIPIMEMPEEAEQTPSSPSPPQDNKKLSNLNLADIVEVDDEYDDQSSELLTEKKRAQMTGDKSEFARINKDIKKKAPPMKSNTLEDSDGQKLSSLESSEDGGKTQRRRQNTQTASSPEGAEGNQVQVKIDIHLDKEDVSIASSFESGSSAVQVKPLTQNNSQVTFGGFAKAANPGKVKNDSSSGGRPSPNLAAIQEDLRSPKESKSVKTTQPNQMSNFEMAMKNLKIKPFVKQPSASSNQEPTSGFFGQQQFESEKDEPQQSDRKPKSEIESPLIKQARAALVVVADSSDSEKKRRSSDSVSITSSEKNDEPSSPVFESAKKQVEVVQPQQPQPTQKLVLNKPQMTRNNSGMEFTQFKFAFAAKFTKQPQKSPEQVLEEKKSQAEVTPKDSSPIQQAKVDVTVGAASSSTSPLVTEVTPSPQPKSSVFKGADITPDGTPMLKTDSELSEKNTEQKRIEEDLEKRKKCQQALMNLIAMRAGPSPSTARAETNESPKVENSSVGQKSEAVFSLAEPKPIQMTEDKEEQKQQPVQVAESIAQLVTPGSDNQDNNSRNADGLSQKMSSASRAGTKSLKEMSKRKSSQKSKKQSQVSVSPQAQEGKKVKRKKRKQQSQNMLPVKKLKLGNYRSQPSKCDAEFEKLLVSQESSPSQKDEENQEAEGENKEHGDNVKDEEQKSSSSCSSSKSISSETSTLKTESGCESDEQPEEDTRVTLPLEVVHVKQSSKALPRLQTIIQEDDQEDQGTEEKTRESHEPRRVGGIQSKQTDKTNNTSNENKQETDDDDEVNVETNVNGLDLNCSESSLDNKSSDSDSLEDLLGGIWRNPDAWDLQQLISVYAQFEREAYFAKKPKLDYRCSRGHCLQNPSIIHRNKIVLQPMEEKDYENASDTKRSDHVAKSDMSEERREFLDNMAKSIKRNIIKRCRDKGSQKFRMIKKSQNIMRAMLKAEREYFEQQFGDKQHTPQKEAGVDQDSLSNIKQTTNQKYRPSTAKGKQKSLVKTDEENSLIPKLVLNKKASELKDITQVDEQTNEQEAARQSAPNTQLANKITDNCSYGFPLSAGEQPPNKDNTDKGKKMNVTKTSKNELFAHSQNSRPSRGIMREPFPRVVQGQVHREIPGFDAKNQKSSHAQVKVKKELQNARTVKLMKEAELAEKGMNDTVLKSPVGKSQEIKFKTINVTSSTSKPAITNSLVSPRARLANLQSTGSLQFDHPFMKQALGRNSKVKQEHTLQNWSARQSLPSQYQYSREYSTIDRGSDSEVLTYQATSARINVRNSMTIQSPTTASVPGESDTASLLPSSKKQNKQVYRHDPARNYRLFQETQMQRRLDTLSPHEIKKEIIDGKDTKQLQKLLDKQRQQRMSKTISSWNSKLTTSQQTATDQLLIQQQKRLSQRLFSPDNSMEKRKSDWLTTNHSFDKEMIPAGNMTMRSTRVNNGDLSNVCSPSRSYARGSQSRNRLVSPQNINTQATRNTDKESTSVAIKNKFLRNNYGQFGAAATKTTFSDGQGNKTAASQQRLNTSQNAGPNMNSMMNESELYAPESQGSVCYLNTQATYKEKIGASFVLNEVGLNGPQPPYQDLSRNGGESLVPNNTGLITNSSADSPARPQHPSTTMPVQRKALAARTRRV